MNSNQQNQNLQRLLKAEEEANKQIRNAKNQRTKIYKEIEIEVTRPTSAKMLLYVSLFSPACQSRATRHCASQSAS